MAEKKKITEPKMNRKNPSEITKLESKSLTEKFVINTSKFQNTISHSQSLKATRLKRNNNAITKNQTE